MRFKLNFLKQYHYLLNKNMSVKCDIIILKEKTINYKKGRIEWG